MSVELSGTADFGDNSLWFCHYEMTLLYTKALVLC